MRPLLLSGACKDFYCRASTSAATAAGTTRLRREVERQEVYSTRVGKEVYNCKYH